jgi:glycosyltransferase involved in cell wall biosynthesis
VLPTHSENFGIAVAEALAHGCPVITTKAAPWQDLQTHNCGWWIDDDVNVLSVTLVEAIQLMEQERRVIGNRGRQLMEKKYSWDNVAEQMTNAYLWCRGVNEKPAYVWDE